MNQTKEKPFSHTLKSISNSVKNIMPEICSVLDKNKIKFVTNPKRTEIIIQNQDEKTIKKILSDDINITDQKIKIAVEFIQLKNTVYIRQKVQ